MTDADSDSPKEPRPRGNWLRSRSCLLVCTLLSGLAFVCFWLEWRGRPQHAWLQYVEELGGEVSTEPARPVWLHALVMATLGEERAAGFTDVTFISFRYTQATDADLQHVQSFTNLKVLILC